MLQVKELSFEELRDADGLLETVEEYGATHADKEVGIPQPDFAAYERLASSGVLRFIGAFEDESVVGFAVLIVSPSRHYEEPAVSTDCIYLRKSARRSGLGLMLLSKMAEVTAREGAKGYAMVAQPGSTLDRLCRAQRLKPIRHLYWRPASYAD
jgi:GNAT superfamily N-acetyltransferase